MSEFGLIETFHIDDNELAGLTPQECFTLGVEWEMVRSELANKCEAISRPVHADNSVRIIKLCEKSGRRFNVTWMKEDASESWMQLDVEPKT